MRQSLLALAERLFGLDTLGDVDRVAKYPWRFWRLVVQDVAVHPDAFAAVLGDQPHQSRIDAVTPNPIEIDIEPGPRSGRQEVAQVGACALSGFISERSSCCRIDEQQCAGEIVSANQTETVLDQLAIAALTLVQGFFSSLLR